MRSTEDEHFRDIFPS